MKKAISIIIGFLLIGLLFGCGSNQQKAGATFTDGKFIPWDKLKETENGVKYGYREYELTDEKIGKEAFYHCYNLKSIIIPEGIKEIEKDAFNGCSGLESIALPGTLVKIDSAFVGLHMLVELIIPEGVEYLGSVGGCDTLRRVVLPSTLKSMNGFSAVPNLNSVKYNGTIEEFKKIEGNQTFSRAYKYLNPPQLDYVECTDGNIVLK